MSLLSPLSLAWLGLLAPLVLLYVLRRRRERRVIGSTLLWDRALRDLRAERPWRRLIPHLSLLLQALALIAGAIALARPAGAGTVPAGARVAVVIDASPSMATLEDDGLRRLDHARRAALAIASSLPPGGTMSVVEAGSEATVLAPLSADVPLLERAISSVQIRSGGDGLEDAIALAGERLRDAPAGSRLVVLTDAARDSEVLAPAGLPLEVQRLGSARPNTAILAIDVRPRRGQADAGGDSSLATEASRDRAEIFVRLGRFGATPEELWVLARIEGRGLIASRRVRVSPDRTEAVLLRADLPPDADGRPAVVRVELASSESGGGSRDDALPLDDVAVAPSPGSRRLPVFLIGEPPASLRRALLADPDAELFATTIEALEARRRDEPDAPELDGLAIYSGDAAAVDPPITAGDAIAIAPSGPSALGISLGEERAAPTITSWDENDPRMRFVTMRDVHLGAARTITEPSVRPLVRADIGTIAGVQTLSDREITVLALDPDDGDWSRRPSYVVLVRNLMERTRQRRAAGGIAPAPLGAPLRILAPEGTEVEVRSPDGQTHRAISHGVAIVPIPAIPGTFVARAAGRELHALRNLLDPEESDPRPRARFATQGEAGATELPQHQASEPAESWPLLAIALLVLLMLEALWATRKGAGA